MNERIRLREQVGITEYIYANVAAVGNAVLCATKMSIFICYTRDLEPSTIIFRMFAALSWPSKTGPFFMIIMNLSVCH